jgi:hypothetical protein
MLHASCPGLAFTLLHFSHLDIYNAFPCHCLGEYLFSFAVEVISDQGRATQLAAFVGSAVSKTVVVTVADPTNGNGSSVFNPQSLEVGSGDVVRFSCKF